MLLALLLLLAAWLGNVAVEERRPMVVVNNLHNDQQTGAQLHAFLQQVLERVFGKHLVQQLGMVCSAGMQSILRIFHCPVPWVLTQP